MATGIQDGLGNNGLCIFEYGRGFLPLEVHGQPILDSLKKGFHDEP